MHENCRRIKTAKDDCDTPVQSTGSRDFFVHTSSTSKANTNAFRTNDDLQRLRDECEQHATISIKKESGVADYNYNAGDSHARNIEHAYTQS